MEFLNEATIKEDTQKVRVYGYDRRIQLETTKISLHGHGCDLLYLKRDHLLLLQKRSSGGHLWSKKNVL